MAVIVSAPSLSTSISYDFRYDLMDTTHPSYWYAFQYLCKDTKDSSAGGYFGLQQDSWLGSSAALFSQFGSDATNLTVGTGGKSNPNSDGGAGASTAIPYPIIRGTVYHIEITLTNGIMNSYITDTSTGVKTFVSSISTPYLRGFDGALLWEEQYSSKNTLTDISNSQATFSNIKFNGQNANFNPFDANSVYLHDSDGSVSGIEEIFIKYDSSYTIKVSPNNSDTITLNNQGGQVYLNTGNYTVNCGSGNDFVKAKAGNVHLNGGAGDDTFVGGSGTNIIDGGTGTNTVNFQGIQSEYTITNNSGTITVIDSKSNRDGTDTLSNIQWLNFKGDAVYQGATQTIKNGFANNTYEFVSGYYTYEQALSLASQHIQNGIRGHLITIESAAEERYIKSLGQSTWMAASDATTETHWLYTTGPNSGQNIIYRDWLPGEPNGATTENNVALWNPSGTYGWVDVSSTNLFGFYVEYEDAKNTSNHAPTVTNPIADQRATKGNAFNLTISPNTFSDQDSGDSLSYSATKSDGSALPTWLQFNSVTMTFSGTPGSNDIGALAVKVTATDKSNASVSDPFNITVSDGTGPSGPIPQPEGFLNVTYYDPNNSGTQMSYDFTWDKTSTVPSSAYWYYFGFFTNNPNMPVGYFGLQLDPKDHYKASGANLYVADARFSVFGSDASNPTVGSGGGYDLSADGGPGVSTAIPFKPIAGNPYHVDITLNNGLLSAYITDKSTGIKSFVSSIMSRNTTAFTGIAIVEEQWNAFSSIGDITPTQATYSNILMDNKPVAISGENYLPNSTKGISGIESVVIKQGNSYTIRTGTNNSDTFNLGNSDSQIWLNAGNYTVNGGSGVDTVHLQGNQNDYTVTNHSGIITVKDNVANRGGTYTLTNIEWLDFISGYTLSLANHSPVVANPVADQTAKIGIAYSLLLSSNIFIDQDKGDTLKYTATKSDGSPLPSWLSFSQFGFAGTPGSADVGTLSIKLTATDDHSASVSDIFNITISNPTSSERFTTPTNPMITAAPNGSTLAAINGVDLVSKAYGGYYDSNNKIHGFISSEWGFITVDVPFASTEPSKGTTVTALPASDLIWGNYRDNLGTSHGFVEYQSKYYQMDNPAGTYGTWINAANNTQAAGAYCDVMGKLHGYIETFTTTGAEFTTVDAPGGSKGTWICGLSYDGRATGFYIDASNSYHGFVYQSGNYSKLDFSTAIHTIPTGINSDGKVVGTYMDSTGWHGFSYANGSYATYDYPNATLTALTNINNHDVVSGIATVGGSNTSFATHFLG